MERKELIKKYWFIGLVAVFALIFVGIYTVTEIRYRHTVIKTAQQDGKYLIYRLGDDVYTADELYEDIYPTQALNNVLVRYDYMVVNKAYETTTEMSDIATSNAQYLLSMYGEETIDSELKAMGFKGAEDLTNYYVYLQKSNQFLMDLFRNDQTGLVDSFIADNNSKVISHILIKVADVETVTNEDGTTTLVAHPTEEEQAKLDEVLGKLGSEDFAELAKQYSEDTSASNGGSLGYYDKSVGAGYVPEFAAAADALTEGQVTEPVLSQYGWHIIRCDASTKEALLENESFVNALQGANPTIYQKAIREKGEELGIVIADPAVDQQILDMIASYEEGGN